MEFTILKNSEVKSQSMTYRIDAEFFKREYLEVVRKVKKRKYSPINDVVSWVTQGPNPVFSKTGVPCLTGRNINKGTVTSSNTDYVGKNEYKKLSRFQLNISDMLITLKGKGSIGKIGYVIDKRCSIFSRDIGILRPSKINAGYLNVFILCKYGKLLVDRGETGGTGQSTLTTSYLKSIPIPRFDIEEQIGDLIEGVEQLRSHSQSMYAQAQTLLLSELGLKNWQPKHQLIFVKNYSDTDQAGRIDSEYYQPKYDELLHLINKNSNYTKLISEIQVCNARGLQPKYSTNGSLDVITSKHILDRGLDFDNLDKTEIVNWDLQKKARIKKGSILTYTTGANIGRTAIYQSEKKALASNHVNILTIEEEDPEYVAFVLNSLIGRLQTERFSAGSAQAELYPRDIERFVIPFIEKDNQTEIQKKVIESFNLRKQSKHLLECAKRTVEMAIEQDEETVLEWLENEIGEIQLFKSFNQTASCFAAFGLRRGEAG